MSIWLWILTLAFSLKVFIGLNNFFAGLIVRPQFMVGGFYAIPYYIAPGHYVYESLVMAVFYQNDKEVLANFESDFYNYLVEIGKCVQGDTGCKGTMYDFVISFFDGEFSHDHQIRNAIILGVILCLSRILTWIALKYIRFAS